MEAVELWKKVVTLGLELCLSKRFIDVFEVMAQRKSAVCTSGKLKPRSLPATFALFSTLLLVVVFLHEGCTVTSDPALHSHADICRAYWLNDCNSNCKNTVEGINTLFSWSRPIWLRPKLTQLFSCIKSAQLWWLWPQMTCRAQRGSTRAWVVGAEWGWCSKRLFTISFNL